MFVVLSDCMLEEYPANVPALRYHIDFKNGGSHLPADEKFMPALHALLCVLMIVLLFLYVMQLRVQAISFQQIHLISLLLGTAMLLQLGAAVLEVMHLRAYAVDGKGFGVGIGSMATRVFQAASEMLVSCTLVAVALGWTLVAQDGGSAGTKNWASTLGLVVAVVVGVQLALELAASMYIDELNQVCAPRLVMAVAACCLDFLTMATCTHVSASFGLTMPFTISPTSLPVSRL